MNDEDFEKERLQVYTSELQKEVQSALYKITGKKFGVLILAVTMTKKDGDIEMLQSTNMPESILDQVLDAAANKTPKRKEVIIT